MTQRMCFAWTLWMCSLTLNALAAPNTDAPRQVIQEAMDEVIGVLKDKDKPSADRQQRIEASVGNQLVAPPERRDHALPNARALALRLDDLEVLASRGP